ncbi:MAG: TlpA family protein disulfide reductase [Deltaproteobacteria bacterium]|nr:TlpA family protein disulfide reductase [Deltaproteobacteria bacterium]
MWIRKNLSLFIQLIILVALSSTSTMAAELAPIQGPVVFSLAKSSGKPLTLVNVWATWCPPCVEEFPELLKFHRKWKDKEVSLQLISVDFASEREKVLSFLKDQGVDFKTFMREGSDEDFVRALDKKWTGALPTTFLMDDKGKILFRWDGAVTVSALEKEIQKHLRPTNSKGEKSK